MTINSRRRLYGRFLVTALALGVLMTSNLVGTFERVGAANGLGHGWLNPVDGQSVSGEITLEVAGSGDFVEFFHGNWVWIGRNEQGVNGWKVVFDTRSLPDGPANFFASFRRADGSLITFIRVDLYVDNSTESHPPSPPEPPPSSPSTYFYTLEPGASLPSGQECAERVRRSNWEPRPENARANQTTGVSTSNIDGASHEGNHRFAGRIDGNFTGTTDEIIQWASCKWGFDEDIVRAVAVMESWWKQSTVGDAGQSFGLMQVKRTVHLGTFPAARDSTAFNIDYALAWRRSCFEGYFSHWLPAERRGDEWACIGHWFAGQNLSHAGGYLQTVQHHLLNRTWEQPHF